MVSGPITSWQIDGKSERKRNSDRLYFLGLQYHCGGLTAATKLKDTCSLEEKLWKARQCIKQTSVCQQRSIESKICFSNSHVWMLELDRKEG